jgi:hypothetical protein
MSEQPQRTLSRGLEPAGVPVELSSEQRTNLEEYISPSGRVGMTQLGKPNPFKTD